MRHMKLFKMHASIALIALVFVPELNTYVSATSAPYINRNSLNSDGSINWEKVDIDRSFTLKLAVWPVTAKANNGEDVVAFSGKFKDSLKDSGKKCNQKGNWAYVYNDDGSICSEYYLFDENVYTDNPYGGEGGIANLKTDGWIDIEGNFILVFDNIDDGISNTDGYRDGIGMNVYSNIEKFNNITFTTNGIMLIEYSDTLSAYNIRKYGSEKPTVYYNFNNEDTIEIKDDDLSPREGIAIGLGNKLYYVNADGGTATGWKTVNNSRYYFKKDGTAANKHTKINGILYRFDKNGVCRGRYNGWAKTSKGYKYYCKGKMLIGNYRIKGKLYQFDENGLLKV